MLQEGGDASARVKQLHLGRDDTLLAQLGYKPEFRRVFTPIEVFGVGFSIIGLLPSLASVLVYSIPYGGPVAMVWGWTVCSIFLIIIGLAMAELGSAAPTIGGLYYWTFMFSSPKWRCLLSWIVGYSNTVGNIASVASVDWGCAVQIMAAASIGSGETFSATTAQTFGLFAGLLLLHASLCSLNPKFIARLQTPFIIVNIVLCLVIIIGVPAATPKEFRNPASFAFGNFQNFSGWNNGFAFILSFLAPLWTIGAFDSTVHISEEARNANTAIPFAMITAATSSSIIGWGINVALAFCMGKDLEGILASPIGQPLAAILFNSFGTKGALAFWAWIIIVQFTIGMSMLTTCSRQIFAFSRDGGLPLSRYLYNVNKHTHAPVNAVWFAAGVSLLLGLLAFAGPSAIGAIFSLVVTGQYLAYSIPIAARFIGQKEVKRGPFSLGKFSLPVAATAVTWMVFIIVVFLFPASPSPDKESFNYTVVVWGGTLALAIGYYYLPVYGGIHWFKGPVQTIGELEISSQSDDEKGSVSDKDSVSKEKAEAAAAS